MAGINFDGLPAWIRGRMKKNIATDLYEIKEGAITYGIPFTLLTSLKKYSHGNRTPSIKTWYNTLSASERKLVKRTGTQETNEFTPDPVYD